MKRAGTSVGDEQPRSVGALDRDQARLQGALGALSAGIIDLIAERDALRRDVARLNAELADAEAQLKAEVATIETRLAEGKRSQELLARITRLVQTAKDSTADETDSGDDESPPDVPSGPLHSRIGSPPADASFRELLDSLLVDAPAPGPLPPPSESPVEGRQDRPPAGKKRGLDAFALRGRTVERPRARGESWVARVLAGASVGALAIAVVLVLGLSAGPRMLPYDTYYVFGRSMEPAIASGSVVGLAPVSFSQVQVGDVITVEPPEAPGTILARVAAIEITAEGRAFVTKGDANATPDNWRVPATGEGYRLLFALPHLGYLLYALHSTAGRITLVVVPAIALGSLILVELWRPPRPRATSTYS